MGSTWSRRAGSRTPATGQVGQALVVAAHDLGPPCLERLQPRQLAQPEGAEDVGQPVVQPELVHLLVPGALVRVAQLVAVAHQADVVEPRGPRCQGSGSDVATAPPSAVVMFLVGKKENVVRSASVPTGRPW